jgi:hypothetical protein
MIPMLVIEGRSGYGKPPNAERAAADRGGPRQTYLVDGLDGPGAELNDANMRQLHMRVDAMGLKTSKEYFQDADRRHPVLAATSTRAEMTKNGERTVAGGGGRSQSCVIRRGRPAAEPQRCGV